MGLALVIRRGPLYAAVQALPIVGGDRERDGMLVRDVRRPGERLPRVFLVRVHDGRPHYVPVEPSLRRRP